VDLDGKGLEEEAKGTESKSTVSGVDTQSNLATVCELTAANLMLKEKKEEKSLGTRRNKAGSKSAVKSIDTQPYCSEASQNGSIRPGKEKSSVFSSEDSDASLSKKNKRKEKKKHEEMMETPRKSPRIKKNQEKIPPPYPEACDDGVTNVIATKLSEAGLEHQAVARNGNCGYIAASYGIFNTHNKWKTIRTAGSKYLKKHKESYLQRIDEELIDVTIKEMEKTGVYIEDFALSVIGDTYNRPIEVWRRTIDGDDIETDLSYSIEDNSILLWYNGQNIQGGEGNHYDVLKVIDEGKFKNRRSKCSRTRSLQEILATTPPTPGGTPSRADQSPVHDPSNDQTHAANPTVDNQEPPPSSHYKMLGR
jgi:hypothetical protein